MGFHLNTPKRSRILGHRYINNLSIRRIAFVENVPKSTVSDVIQSGFARSKRRTQTLPKYKITKLLLGRLITLIRHGWSTRTLPLKSLAEQCGITASKSTIYRALSRVGYKRYIAVSRPFINKIQQAKRLQFSVNSRRWNQAYVRQIIWSDECSFEAGKRGRIWVTRQKREKFNQDCIKSIYRSGRTSIMIWGAIGWGYKSPLVILQKSEGNKGINSANYRDQVLIPIMGPILAELSQGGFHDDAIYMEDGAKVHQGHAKQYGRDIGINYLEGWPPSSPDFNPIEKVWRVMKQRIQARNPFPTSKVDLLKAIHEEWDRIDPMDFMWGVENWNTIMEECIKQKGLSTR